MIKYTTYLCGGQEKGFFKEVLDKVALQGRVQNEDIERISREVDRLFGVVAREVTEQCQTQKT